MFVLDPEKTCRDAKDTVSGIIGWWGGKSESLSQLSQCAVEDFPAGLQAIKYRPQANFKQPDEVYYNLSDIYSREQSRVCVSSLGVLYQDKNLCLVM